MVSRRTFATLAAIVAVAFSAVTLWAGKEFVRPHPENANTYPAKDAHPNDKITAAIELYNAAPQSDIFITPYVQEGILPVLLIVSNDGDYPITINNLRAELVTTRHARLSALDTDDVFRRVAHLGNGTSNKINIGPIAIGKNKNKTAQKQYQEITSAIFAAEAVEPHTTKSGFLFFDIQNVRDPVDGAHVYLTGIRDAGGSELMYFDISVIPSNAAASSGQ